MWSMGPVKDSLIFFMLLWDGTFYLEDAFLERPFYCLFLNLGLVFVATQVL